MDSIQKKSIIVFTTSYLPFIGGSEITIQEVSRRLSKTFNFYIITARQRRNLPQREVFPEGTVIRVGFGMWFDKWLLPVTGVYAVMRLSMSNTIAKPIRRSSRLLLLFWGMDISQGSLVALILKICFPHIAFVFTVQYGYGDSRIKDGRMGAIGIAFRRILKSADVVTVISSYLFDVATAYGYIGARNIIPNGVDTALFDFARILDRERTESRPHILITTSRLVHKNGIDILIRAVAELKKIIPNLKCHIIGGGPEKRQLEKIVEDLDITENIIFLGDVPYKEIPFYLKKADIFVRPSRSEGMGNSFIEALSAGIPIIGTAVGGIPDIIDDKKTGLFCRMNDPIDLSQKILLLLEDKRLVARMRKNGRRLVEEKFSWDVIAASYKKIFDVMLEARTRVLIATPLYPPEIGGPATYSKILADECFRVGIPMRIVRFSDVQHMPKIIRHLIFCVKIMAQSRSTDIIYAQDPVSVGFPAVIAATIMRKRFVVKIVGDYAWEQGVQRFGVSDLLDDFLKKTYGKKVELLRRIQTFTARHAQRIIVPSNYLKYVVMQWGILPEKITVIPNSFEIFDIVPSYKEARHKLGLQGHIIVSAGRLVPWKGFELLIDVVFNLIKEIPDLYLIIVGAGPLDNQLREYVTRAQGSESHVQFTGSVSHNDLLTYLAASDAFVLNTGYEGFSHVILEAMTMGVPVVSTAVGGNQELIDDGRSGFLVAYNDREALHQRIYEILRMDRNKRNDIIAHARMTAQEFTKKRMLEDTVRILNSL